MAYSKLIFGVIMAWSALAQLFSNQTWWFIQNVNLIFHEAGHVIFGILGGFMGLIGGSLLEILIPAVVTAHFALHRHFASAAFGCWWLSTALLSVSIYAADARERSLPLITNDITTHDWFNILNQFDLLQYDNVFGYFFWMLGLVSVAFLLYFLTLDHAIKLLLHRDTLR